MDVRFTALALAGVFFLIGCSENKSADIVSRQKAQMDSKCSQLSLNKTQFIVRYEDGHVEVHRAENSEVFTRDYVEPNLHLIRSVEYDSVVKLLATDNDHNSGSGTVNILATDWGLTQMNAEYAWNQGFKGQGVKVAVIDAAVDYTHPQLAPRLAKNDAEFSGGSGVDDDGNGLIDDKYGWDFAGNSPALEISYDSEGHPNLHGTHVAGIILADPTTGDVSGVAPQADLVPVNFMGQDGSGGMGAAIQGIRYAVARGAKVINASWGGNGCSPELEATIKELASENVLFVAAAGNESVDFDRNGNPDWNVFPAMFNALSQITVAATDSLDEMAGFSNRGYSVVHLAAPGVNIRSTIPKRFAASGSGFLSGTSMATPFVSGTAALMWSAKPAATVAQIKQALLNATEFRSLKVSTQGRLNVQKAVDEIRRIAP